MGPIDPKLFKVGCFIQGLLGAPMTRLRVSAAASQVLPICLACEYIPIYTLNPKPYEYIYIYTHTSIYIYIYIHIYI